LYDLREILYEDAMAGE